MSFIPSPAAYEAALESRAPASSPSLVKLAGGERSSPSADSSASTPLSGVTVDREGNIIDLATGEIDECLMAQLGLGTAAAIAFFKATRESQGMPADAIARGV